jgi:hypothetical protein
MRPCRGHDFTHFLFFPTKLRSKPIGFEILNLMPTFRRNYKVYKNYPSINKNYPIYKNAKI